MRIKAIILRPASFTQQLYLYTPNGTLFVRDALNRFGAGKSFAGDLWPWRCIYIYWKYLMGFECLRNGGIDWIWPEVRCRWEYVEEIGASLYSFALASAPYPPLLHLRAFLHNKQNRTKQPHSNQVQIAIWHGSHI